MSYATPGAAGGWDPAGLGCGGAVPSKEVSFSPHETDTDGRDGGTGSVSCKQDRDLETETKV